jgi:Protein of unknown function (DUF2851)
MDFANEMEIQRYWAGHPFADTDLKSACNSIVRILNPGRLNSGSGPDFTDATILIDSFTWFGSVEIHRKSSEWMEHKHHLDPAYNNVILHVVLQHDREVFKENGERLIVYQIAQRNNLQEEIGAKLKLPMDFCSTDWAEKRLKRKSAELKLLPEAIRADYEGLFHRLLFSAYGIHQNILPFEQLAVVTPYPVLMRERNLLPSVEALLFGQSGLLHAGHRDSYPKDLYQRYETLCRKYQLRPMNPVSWKQMRMRPANFPCLRLSQLAVMISGCDRPMNTLLNETSFPELRKCLYAEATEYWNTHYSFDSETTYSVRSTGNSFLDAVIINAVAVMKYFLGEVNFDRNLSAEALELLICLPPEKNTLITKRGFAPGNALESQAALEIIRTNRY